MAHMKAMSRQAQVITFVRSASPAARAGVARGETLLSINGEAVCDIVDYEYLSAEGVLTLRLVAPDGTEREISIAKDPAEPLGLDFDAGLMDAMQSCHNRCLFCFIDQMPKGVRTSLHIKDDDWRMSFIMGNYITLTNVDEAAFERIIARRVSPLYISLHASDPAIRTRMMQNPGAGEIMPRLMRLRAAGLFFHLQIVLCPGINDGEALMQTLRDVESLLPAVKSLAIVPVGLTKYREGLYALRANRPEEARRLIDSIEPVQAAWLKSAGTRLVFLSDEWYMLAGRPLPTFDSYEDFPQIENGVGLLRLFEHDFLQALALRKPRKRALSAMMAGGESACASFAWMPDMLRPYGISLSIMPIRNDYFGGGVNVSGLVTGGDLVAQLSGRPGADPLLIPRAMLRENDEVFLDGMTLGDAQKILRRRIRPVADGADMIEILFRRKI